VLALGLGVTFVGYSLVYYGLTQVQGGNWGYLDLVIPMRWNSSVAATPRDGVGDVSNG
jgi:drug/metabolite transporter (DMT)-like permease